MKPKIFVGSSREALPFANGIHENLHHDAEITVWNHGIVDLSQSTLESLLDTLEHMDFGVFVFAPDDILEIRGEQNTTTRDNVVFELGLFVGRLGRERSFIFLPNDQEGFRLPTDLLGMTPGIYESSRSDANFMSATAVACNAVRRRIAQLEPDSRGREAASAPQQEEIDTKKISETSEETKQGISDGDESQDWGWLGAYFDEDWERMNSLLEKEIEAADKDKDTFHLELWLGEGKAKLNFRSGIEWV